MNTADECINRRRLSRVDMCKSQQRVRHSTELPNNNSFRKNIKIISTKFPADFFKNIEEKRCLSLCKLKKTSQANTEATTPRFSKLKESALTRDSDGRPSRVEQITRFNEDEVQILQTRLLKDSESHGKIRRRPAEEQKICLYIQQVIQLTSSIKKLSSKKQQKKLPSSKRGSIIDRQNIVLPSLVLKGQKATKCDFL